jgi:NAD(P)-dependent dehydrogenase (short-subunit alcohol dehydrogenase family)
MNKNILVIGATGGIGRELCNRLREQGANLHLVARDESGLRELATRLDAKWTTTDVTDPIQVKNLFQECATPDGVVLSVGSVMLKSAHRLKDDEWHSTLNQNLNSAFYVIRSSTKAMMKQGGSIVLISTSAAQIGFANHEAIAAAKLGVEGLARSTAASYSNRNIRVNVVAPGLVDTPLTKTIINHAPTLEASRKMHSLGRIGTPGDIAHAIQFLLESNWITGQTLTVDGGLSGIKLPR